MTKVPKETEVDSVNQFGCLMGRSLGLSTTQKKVLDLLLSDHLTPARTALYLNISRQAVYKIIKKLQNLGYINRDFQGRLTMRGLLTPPLNTSLVDKPPSLPMETHNVRLHSVAWKVRILHRDRAWKQRILRSNKLIVDSNTVMMYDRQIVIYCGHSFVSEGVHDATKESVHYLEGLLRRLETEFKLVLLKERAENILQFRAHYAEMNNELATLQLKERQPQIKLFAKEDGKLWFTIDNSFNFKEAETQHPRTAAEDMDEVVKPFFNDLRRNKPPSLSEVMGLIHEVVLITKETAAGLNSIVQLMGVRAPEGASGGGEKPDYLG